MLSATFVFFIIFSLFFKHIVVDFPVYTGYVCRTRPHYAELVWKLHNIAHGLFTALILTAISIPVWLVWSIALGEIIFHYIVDSMTVYFEEKCKEDKEFEDKWYWVAELDQYLHGLSYVSIAFIIFIVL